MNIYLIGMPGSGKTTLGKELAKSLHYSFVDMDQEIEKSSRKSINEIFEQDGEEEFRDLEQDILHEVSTGKNLVISTGGGAPCFFDNMAFINRSGLSIFIDVPSEELFKRMEGNTETRPMFKEKSQEEIASEIKEKHATRLPFYSQAQLTISGDNIQLNNLLDKLNNFQG